MEISVGQSDAHSLPGRAKSLQSCPTLCDPSLPVSPPMEFSKSPGVDSRALLQGIFPTQGWNPRLMSPALTSRFFTTSATWGEESRELS